MEHNLQRERLPSTRLEDVEREIEETKALCETVQHANEEYEVVMKEKEKLIHDLNSIWSEELYEIADKEAELRADLTEYQEAIVAGTSSVNALEQAVQSLEKAEGWATWDMVGGGMISTALLNTVM